MDFKSEETAPTVSRCHCCVDLTVQGEPDFLPRRSPAVGYPRAESRLQRFTGLVDDDEEVAA